MTRNNDDRQTDRRAWLFHVGARARLPGDHGDARSPTDEKSEETATASRARRPVALLTTELDGEVHACAVPRGRLRVPSCFPSSCAPTTVRPTAPTPLPICLQNHMPYSRGSRRCGDPWHLPLCAWSPDLFGRWDLNGQRRQDTGPKGSCPGGLPRVPLKPMGTEARLAPPAWAQNEHRADLNWGTLWAPPGQRAGKFRRPAVSPPSSSGSI